MLLSPPPLRMTVGKIVVGWFVNIDPGHH
jgi:hypothetical protein